jgi:glycosyltransferase involved in cell wall biosynthesis
MTMNKKSRLYQNFDQLYEDALQDHMIGMNDKLVLLQQEISSLRSSSLGSARGPMTDISAAMVDFLPKDRLDRLENSNRAIVRELQYIHQRISGMRIDRQIRIAPSYIWKKLRKDEPQLIAMAPPKAPTKPSAPQREKYARKSAYDVVVMCPVYPGGMRPYGGEFIFKRVKAYARAGLKVCVLEVNPKRSDEQDHEVAEVRVLRCGLARATEFLAQTPPPKAIAVHQLERPLWDVIKPYRNKIPTTVWIHGFEARHWRELEDNFSYQELKTLQKTLDEVTEVRRETMREVLSDAAVKKIFVSAYMRSVTEKFTDTKATNTEVIHNPILESDFPYRPKSADDRYAILWVRSFGARNYSNDLSRDAIIELSKRDYFDKLKFSIYGDGKLFGESTDPLQGFENVSINRQFVPTEKLRALHGEHGIMLVPSRWDSQGLTCGEAMSSGLVPITNHVAALPEFVDDDCGFLCRPNDPVALANAIETCIKDPELYLDKSKAAAKRSQDQCGEEETLKKEIRLIRNQIKA